MAERDEAAATAVALVGALTLDAPKQVTAAPATPPHDPPPPRSHDADSDSGGGGSDGDDAPTTTTSGFLPFPSIGKLERVIKDLPRLAAKRSAYHAALAADAPPAAPADAVLVPEQIKFVGTVKLHGCHSDIILRPPPPPPSGEGGGDDSTTEPVLQLQSRNKVVTPGGKTDHAQMAGKLMPHAAALRGLAEQARARAGGAATSTVLLAGEWCGPGVQKGVAISKLPHAFYLVGVRVDGVWQPRSVVEGLRDHAALVYNIYDYETFELVVDVRDPQAALDRAMELTTQVDAECPVAKARGATGHGEGIVWVPDLDSPTTPAWLRAAPGAWFKTKGDSHLAVAAAAPIAKPAAAGPSRIAPLAGVAPEVAAGLAKLATRGRCLQAIEFQREMGGAGVAVCAAKAGSWVAQDVVKEEGEALEAMGLKLPKDKGTVFKVAVAVAKDLVAGLLAEEQAAGTPGQ